VLLKKSAAAIYLSSTTKGENRMTRDLTDEDEEYVRTVRAAALLQAESEAMTRKARRMLHKIEGDTPYYRKKAAAKKAVDEAATAEA
jgi:hypothetical protein